MADGRSSAPKPRSRRAPKAASKGTSAPAPAPKAAPAGPRPATTETSALARRSVALPAATGMRLRIAGVLRWLLDWLFAPVHFPDDAEQTLRALSEKGTVVYVARGAGLLPYLYFNWAFLKLGLPLAHYVNGVRAGMAALFGRGLKPDRPMKRLPTGTAADEARLMATVDADHPALVFLWRRGRALSGRKDTFGSDHAAALVRLQRDRERPIYLVPTLLLFGQRPGKKGARPGLFDVVFGPREAPGRLRAFLSFLRYRKSAWVKLGTPVDLRAQLAEHPDTSDRRLGRMARGALSQYLAREERVVTGPPLKDPRRLQMEILRDHRLQDQLAEVAHGSKRSLGEVRREARRDLREIAARYSPSVVALLDRFLTFVFHRIFDGIEVDQEGLARVAEVAKNAPLVLCPSHRSHVDYLVLSWVFYHQGLTPPHIAAGKNLSFWPLGTLLRRGGGFFLRRSFKDDPVYSAIFRAYVKKLMRDGYTQEFFIEGTRSRTGKVLPPRLGMVRYEVEAFLESNRRDVAFVPISIGYTRVIEAKGYREEQLGAEKKKESVRGVIAARKILRARYGRIHIRFGEPISLERFLAARDVGPASGDDDRRDAVRALSWQIAYGIDRHTTVLPTMLAAAGLLAQRRRGIEMDEALEAARFYAEALRWRGDVPMSPELSFDADGRLEAEPIEAAVRVLASEGMLRTHKISGRLVIEIVPEGRILLDYYKNGLVGFLVEPALVATAIDARLERGAKAVPEAAARADVASLSRLLSHEFVFRPGVDPDAVFDETVATLVSHGLVEQKGKRPPKLEVQGGGETGVSRLALLVTSLVEGYWLTLCAAAERLADQPMAEKDLVDEILESGRVLVLTGRLAAPEALGKPVVQAALGTAVARGLLVREGRRGERLRAPEPKALEAMAAELAPFLGDAP